MPSNATAAAASAAPVALVWLRQDLRLSDQPALACALEDGAAVVPVFVWDPAGEGRWAPGGAGKVWLHHALADLDAQLRERGGRLILRAGDSLSELRALARETGATRVYWNRRYEPAAIARDAAVKAALKAAGLHAESANGALLHEPHTVATGAGQPYQVYTPYSKAVFARGFPRPVEVPPLRFPAAWPESRPLAALELLPKIPWDAPLRAAWTMTRAGAEARLRAFAAAPLASYAEARDLPAEEDGTSRLSPYLHWGQVGSREVVAAVTASPAAASRGAEVYLKEIVWREFAHHILFHFPQTPEAPLRPAYAAFPWVPDADFLRAWQRGRTGYPVVDAGMRQLWATGWMHNRVRMIVASLLVKHLLQPWQRGAEWFWDTLVDADLAANTLGWQWTAGCGADAAPYFRVFNPITQAEKFDPGAAYLRRWVPELAKVPGAYVFQPWTLPPELRRVAGPAFADYPKPVIDHAAGRARALAAFAQVKAAAE